VFGRRLTLKAGDRIRTGDVQLGNAAIDDAGSKPDKELRRGAPALARILHADPGLARIAEAWPELPEAIRRAMLALVESAGPGLQDGP
jgi:hypothetical protein